MSVIIFIRINEVKTNFDKNPLSDQARFIECSFATSIRYIRVISLYAPNGGEVGSDKFVNKLEFYDVFTNVYQTSRFSLCRLLPRP